MYFYMGGLARSFQWAVSQPRSQFSLPPGEPSSALGEEKVAQMRRYFPLVAYRTLWLQVSQSIPGAWVGSLAAVAWLNNTGTG